MPTVLTQTDIDVTVHSGNVELHTKFVIFKNTTDGFYYSLLYYNEQLVTSRCLSTLEIAIPVKDCKNELIKVAYTASLQNHRDLFIAHGSNEVSYQQAVAVTTALLVEAYKSIK